MICGGSADTSRCVAEKKYTEQQAKKLFPQVFVPVCNPDGTYSEVAKKKQQHKNNVSHLCLTLK